MKVVQSFWSKPHLVALGNSCESRSGGGWLSDRYHYMSWALSCSQLVKFYENVELVTDQKGKELLIDKLGLPYSSTVIVLDNLNDYHEDLWALGKLYTYSLQEDPFIHIDGDAYIWQKFSDSFLGSDVIVQHLEWNYKFYLDVMDSIKDVLKVFPSSITNYWESSRMLNAYNMGLVGGNNIDFFKRYVVEAFEFIRLNRPFLEQIQRGPFNTIYEQVLFFCLAQESRQKVNPYSHKTGESLVDFEFKSLSSFRKAGAGSNMIHLYGNCKQELYYCLELERKLKTLYPVYYERIMDLTGGQSTSVLEQPGSGLMANLT